MNLHYCNNKKNQVPNYRKFKDCLKEVLVPAGSNSEEDFKKCISCDGGNPSNFIRKNLSE